MSKIRELLKYLVTSDYLGKEHKRLVLLEILRDPNLIRQATRELCPPIDTREQDMKIEAALLHLDPRWNDKQASDFASVEVQIAGGRSAIEVAMELQDRLLNANEVVHGRRKILRESSFSAYVQMMKLRIAQLNSAIAIDDRGEPINQARYDALILELHRLRHQ